MRSAGFISSSDVDASPRLQRRLDYLASYVAGCTPDVQNWYASLVRYGGSVTMAEIDIANTLSLQLNASAYYSNIKLLFPFIGGNIAAGCTPLIDQYGLRAQPHGFGNSDFSTSVGITSGTLGKFLDFGITPKTLATVTGGTQVGIGYFARSVSHSGTTDTVIGVDSPTSSPDDRLGIDLRSTSEFFSYGLVANRATTATAASASHYYGEAPNNSSKVLYKNGTSVATNSTLDSFGNDSLSGMQLMGVLQQGVQYYAFGTCGCAYFTDGTLGSTGASALHTLLTNYLITPTGR